MIWLLASLAASAADEVVVISYNILRPSWAKPGDPSWAQRVDGIVKIIETHDPDLVGLQEENDGMVSDLLDRMRGRAYLYPVPLKGAGILFSYRKWTPVTVRHEDAPGERVITEALFRGPGGRRLYVYNAHLHPFEERLRLEGAAILARMIATRAEAAVPVVVTGDMNAAPDAAPMHFLLKDEGGARLTDPVALLGLESTRTSDAYKEPWTREGRRIDYVLFAGALRPLDTTVIEDRVNGVFPSDHLPIRAVFAWEAKK